MISTRSTKNNAAVLSPDTTSLVQICSGQQVDLTSCESDLPDVPLKVNYSLYKYIAAYLKIDL